MNFRVRMHGRIRSGADSTWMPLRAEQYTFVDARKRFFYLTSSMFGVPVQGYHRYTNSSASMVIKAAAVVPVVRLRVSGVLLWRRRSLGQWIGAAAGIQASLYLTVLSVNSALAVRNGRAEAPGEFPVWGTFALLTVAATLLLLRGVRDPHSSSLAA